MADGFDTARLDSNPDDGNRRRRYDSSLRRAQAEQTHQAVLDAGCALFLERGYARATMRDIAQRAGVAVDSVYGHFRSKAALITELMDRAHGADAGLAIAERDWVRDVRARDGVGEQLDALAAGLAEVYESVAPLNLVLRRAADAEATAARIWAQRNAERLAGLQRYADRLAESGALRMDAGDIRDVLYAVASPELYGLLVLDRGWTKQRYVTWLAGTLRAALLDTN